MLKKLYEVHYSLVKNFIHLATFCNCRPIGLAIGTLALELSSALCMVGRRLRYSKQPKHYGINHFRASHKGKNPVILLHGRMSHWVDLMDLALSIKFANIPVFFISLQNQHPTESDRHRINEEVEKIQNLYREEFNEDCPLIDIVGHSLGGDMALYSAFAPGCSIIERGNLKFMSEPQPNPPIGRIITLGMPTNSLEIDWIWAAGKKREIFNIVAKFDAIMGSKECALIHKKPKQVLEIDTGHLGILNMATYIQVMQWLLLDR